MNKPAFVFRTPPHGTASGREGLDAVLAASALTDELAVFFIGDGVYQILEGQDPGAVLTRNYTPTFGLFELYDIESIYVCAESLVERGLSVTRLSIAVQALSRDKLVARLADFNVRLSF
ncbi:sulfurtransferase complex subunit TusC [Zobellella maritima]|uniref:sulfurtransferase complex subunit TusC n=1 Tax=Zobellella maritima TaxID=2059725 RepID=UPI000E30A952|nr:sulfurtransferase complex subunit TusC [Zobellella maritima]